jgi:hypothetical protein
MLSHFLTHRSHSEQPISTCRPLEAALAAGAQRRTVESYAAVPEAFVKNRASLRRRRARVEVSRSNDRSPSTGPGRFFGTLTGTPSTGRGGTWPGRGRSETSPTTPSGDCCCAGGSQCRRGASGTPPIASITCTGSCAITAPRSCLARPRRRGLRPPRGVDLSRRKGDAGARRGDSAQRFRVDLIAKDYLTLVERRIQWYRAVKPLGCLPNDFTVNRFECIISSKLLL